MAKSYEGPGGTLTLSEAEAKDNVIVFDNTTEVQARKFLAGWPQLKVVSVEKNKTGVLVEVEEVKE